MNGHIWLLAILVIVLLWGLWVLVAAHPALRDRYDHWTRLHFRQELRWLHVHILLALILALLITPLLLAGAYVIGYQTAPRYDAAYFEQHFKDPGLCLLVKHKKCVISVPPKLSHPLPQAPLLTLPAQATIDIARYPAVGTQGPLGSCAAWASAWAGSYEWRVIHPTSTLRFSPRCEYDHYVKTYDGGVDAGSMPDGDIEQIPTGGVTRFYRVPYGTSVAGRPSYAVDTPVPGECSVYGVTMPIHGIPLTPYYTGLGQPAVDAARKTIAGVGTNDGKRHPVLIGMALYSEYYNATNQPNIVAPKKGETWRGAHMNVILAYDDTRLMPDGTVGAFLIQNQWGTYWGLGGRAWLSYDYVRKWSMGEEYLSSSPGLPQAGKNAPPADGGKRPFIPPPGASRVTKPIAPPSFGASGWYIQPFRTRDTGLDISGLINHNRWGIWPVYLLAVVMAESNGNQYAARWGVWPDVSFGLVQVTTATLTGYYSGCGFNSYCAQGYLDSAATSIDLGAHILRDYMGITGVGYPALWECYNAGPGSCQSPYYGAFLQNYYVALSYATNSAGPAPKPFPKTRWYHWCTTHPHKPCQSYLYKGKLSWAASVWLHYQGLGGVKGNEVYYARQRGRTHGYTQTAFVHGVIECWQDYHVCGVYDTQGRKL